MLTDRAVRALAARQGEPAMTSLYLDVDGRRFPRPSDYQPHLDGLVRTARKKATEHAPDAAKTIDADLARITDWVHNRLDRGKVRGVAAFAAPGFFEVVALPVEVDDLVAVDRHPDVAPLCAILAASAPTLVVDVDSQRSRLLRLGLGGVRELESPTDELERQADTDNEIGSWERRRAEHDRDHIHHVAHCVVQELARRPANFLVLSGSSQPVTALESQLPEHVAELVVGRIAVPIQSENDVLVDAARRVVEAAQREREDAIVQELRVRAAEGSSAVAGLDPTLDAMASGQVTTLVVARGFGLPGGRCADCGRLTVTEGPCSQCGGEVRSVDNVVDAVITDAFAHHARLVFSEDGALDDLDRIGAILRH